MNEQERIASMKMVQAANRAAADCRCEYCRVGRARERGCTQRGPNWKSAR